MNIINMKEQARRKTPALTQPLRAGMTMKAARKKGWRSWINWLATKIGSRLCTTR